MASRLCFFISGLQDRHFLWQYPVIAALQRFQKTFCHSINVFVMNNLYTLKNFKPSNVFLLFAAFFIIAVFSFNSCSKDVDDSIPKPIATLIKSIKSDNPDCTCDPYIAEYFWQNKTVYLRGFTGPTCNWIPIYYDSTGSILTMPANYTPNDFQEESSFIKTVWSCQQH